MSTVLFEQGEHRCIAFNNLVRGEHGVQANQFLIVDGHHSAVLDPGGALLYNPLILALGNHVKPDEIDYVLCSHQDPDVIGSADKWLLYTQATLVCSKLWGRFVPHSVPGYMQNSGPDRYRLLEDKGEWLQLGQSRIRALPAHFMHSVGNFSFYDETSRILFSGDVGASLVPNGDPYRIVEDDFDGHSRRMLGFHRRYMASNRVTRLWVDMVRRLDPVMIAPQHGLPMRGQAKEDFLDWLERLECGVDLLGQNDYLID